MSTTERRDKLLQLLESDKYVDIKTLVDELKVSEATVRRDLGYLANVGTVVRTHGGAYFTSNKSTAHEPLTDYRQRLLVTEKKAIGLAAAELVSPGETIIVDSGSTTWYLVEALFPKKPLTVVSNDIKILSHLADFSGFTVIDTGGTIYPESKTLLSPDTVNLIRGLHVNWVFLGATAIDVQYGITSAIMEEASVKQAMIHAGQKVVVLADHTKFGKTAFTHVCRLDEVDMVITDAGIEAEQAAEVRALGVDLRIADKILT